LRLSHPVIGFLEGFIDLVAEFQLKAEEVIGKLHDDKSAVSVK
jgi:hypothetical protein